MSERSHAFIFVVASPEETAELTAETFAQHERRLARKKPRKERESRGNGFSRVVNPDQNEEAPDVLYEEDTEETERSEFYDIEFEVMYDLH